MENKQLTGWKDIQLNGDMPLNALVNFLNILNQRLANVEDNVFIRDENNQMISLSVLYARQSEAAEKAAQEKPEDTTEAN